MYQVAPEYLLEPREGTNLGIERIGLVDLDDPNLSLKQHWSFRLDYNRSYLVCYKEWDIKWSRPLLPAFSKCQSIEEIKIKCDLLGIKHVSDQGKK